MKIGEIRSYVIIGLIALTVCGITYVMGAYHSASDSRKVVCDITSAQLAVPAGKPADPSLHPGREQLYLLNQKFLLLNRAYNCKDETSR